MESDKKQHIKELLAKGNRFEAMNLFLNCKFGKLKPDDKTNSNTSVSESHCADVKKEASETKPASKHDNNISTEVIDNKTNEEQNEVNIFDSEGSDVESESEVSDAGGPVNETHSEGLHNESLEPDVVLKEDENLDVDVETVDPPNDFGSSSTTVAQQQHFEHAGPAHVTQQQQLNIQVSSYGQMGGMPSYGGGPYCSTFNGQMVHYEHRTIGTNTPTTWIDMSHSNHIHQHMHPNMPPHQLHQQQQQQQQQHHHHHQQHHLQQQQQQHQQHQQQQENLQKELDYVPKIQRDKEPLPTEIHKKTHQKFFRDQGRPYLSRATGKEVRGRAMGPPCNCKKKCWSKIEDGATEIFSAFWDMGNFDEQNVYLYGNISIKPVSRHYVKGSNRRTYTFTYWCKVRGKHVEVCKEMFMGVHGLQNSRGRIGNLMKQMKDGNMLPKPDQRGKHANRPNKYSEQSLRGARQHIEAYINRNMTLKKMYRDYYEPWCAENKIIPVSEDKYRRIYSEEYKF